jgi:hypothetical protein
VSLQIDAAGIEVDREEDRKKMRKGRCSSFSRKRMEGTLEE